MLPRGNLAIMTIAACLSGMSSISLTFLPVYFTSLGGTVTQYGLVTGIAMLSGIPATVAGGAIVPRRRLKRVMIATSWLGPTVLLGYYFSSNWIALSIVMVIATASNIGSTTSRQLIADATIRKNRAGQLSLYQTFLNLPAMFSPAVGGYLVTTLGMSEGFKLGLLFGIGASIASVALIIRYLRDKPSAEEECKKNPGRSGLDDDDYLSDKISSSGYSTFREEKEIIPVFIRFRVYTAIAQFSQSVASHFTNFFKNSASLPKSLTPILAAYALVTAANATAGSYFIFYATGVVKIDTFQWGLILSLQLALANLIRTPLGMVADRHERRRMLLLAIALTAPLASVFVLMHSFWGLLAVSLAMVATGIHYGPTHEAYQIELTPRDKRPALFVIYDVLSNGSKFAGVVLGGLLFAVYYALPFYTYTALEVCAAGIIGVSLLLSSRKGASGRPDDPQNPQIVE